MGMEYDKIDAAIARNTETIARLAKDAGEYVEAHIKVSDHIDYTSVHARVLTCKHCGKQYGARSTNAYALHAGRGLKAMTRHIRNEHGIIHIPTCIFGMIFASQSDPMVKAWKKIKAEAAL